MVGIPPYLSNKVSNSGGFGGAGAAWVGTGSGVLAFLPKAEPRLSWKSREPHLEHFDGFASSEATPHLLQTLMAMFELPWKNWQDITIKITIMLI
jgi:hypothetical protein